MLFGCQRASTFNVRITLIPVMNLVLVWEFDAVVISDRRFNLFLLFDRLGLFDPVSHHAQGYFVEMSEKLSVTFEVLRVKRSTGSRLLFLTLLWWWDAHVDNWLPLRFSSLFLLFEFFIRIFAYLFQVVVNDGELGHSVKLHVVRKYDYVFVFHQLFEFLVPILTAHVFKHIVGNIILFSHHGIKQRERPLLLESGLVMGMAVVLKLARALVLGSHVICNANRSYRRALLKYKLVAVTRRSL